MGGLLGSSNSGSSNSSTSTSKVEPWGPSQGPLKAVMGESMNLYNSGGLPQAWQGSSIVPFMQQQMSGLSGMEQAAQSGNPLTSGVLNSAQGVLNGGGLTSGQQANLGNISGVASGQNSIGTGGQYQGLLNGLGSPNASNSLAQMASGQMVGANNPLLMQNLGTAAGKATDSINSTFSAGGRYGSGAHQGTVGETVGDIYSQGLMGQMNEDIRNWQGAAGQMDNARNAQASSQMGALQGLTGVEGANIANRVGAGQTLNDIYSQGNQQAMQIGALAPAFDQMRYADSQKMFDIGGVQRGQLQNELNDRIRVHDQNQSRPMDNINWLAGLLGGAAGYGNSQQTTTQNPQGSPLAGALGGAATGAGILGGLYPGGGAPGWASMLGIGGGGLLGAMM